MRFDLVHLSALCIIGIVLASVRWREALRRVEKEMRTALQVGDRDYHRGADCRRALRGPAIDERQTVADPRRSGRVVSAESAGRRAYFYQSCGSTGQSPMAAFERVSASPSFRIYIHR